MVLNCTVHTVRPLRPRPRLGHPLPCVPGGHAINRPFPLRLRISSVPEVRDGTLGPSRTRAHTRRQYWVRKARRVRDARRRGPARSSLLRGSSRPSTPYSRTAGSGQVSRPSVTSCVQSRIRARRGHIRGTLWSRSWRGRPMRRWATRSYLT